MELGFVEDFTSNVQLDSDLFALPTSGLYLNSGVHPSITIDNLLQFLPRVDFQLGAWAVGLTYDAYLPERNRGNLVTDGTFIYQSLQDNNQGNPLNDTAFWRKTNWESIHLKNMIEDAKNRVYADLNLTKRLVNNQYVYEEGDQIIDLPNDFAAWTIEPKGSDYVSFRINEWALQAMTTNPVDIYVINQGVQVGSFQITPNNGILSFGGVPYTFSGKGQWRFAFDSQQVKVRGGWIDPLKYNGFVCYTSSGTGASAAAATWSDHQRGNGLGFNITAFLDASLYIQHNLNEFANYIRATFEYMAFEMFYNNSKNRNNKEQRNIMDEKLLLWQVTDLQGNSSVKRYNDEKKKALQQIQRTFDTQLFEGTTDTSVNVSFGW